MQANYESAMKFLEMLKEKLPDWVYDSYEAEIEYIQEMLWRYEDLSNS